MVLMIHQCSITTNRESPGMRVVLPSNLPLGLKPPTWPQTSHLASNLPLGREVPFKHLVLKMRVNVYKLPLPKVGSKQQAHAVDELRWISEPTVTKIQ
jgi:hypothetical protein